MKGFIALALAAGVAVAATAPADAAGGCGRGFHPGPHGRCFPNGGPGRGPALIVGNRYDRGYWDGHRYYQHRERYRDGWRYR
ncbi:GCG_CRPN prefix-to-repeats domain-containing protein [Sphingomonas bacterium]|uniref:GCG_CRPN prefix-to-repeats domain-containing protein n=1 Tax=Sphingomonas bacterium TaxID=1895847 RepID=UPI001575371C|nr:hypothetical protein [Sphingomonas bacterium]